MIPFPGWLTDLGRRAIADAYRDPAAGAAYRPDIALVNHYDGAAKMDLHQHRDERSAEPVVSVSVGEPPARSANCHPFGQPIRLP